MASRQEKTEVLRPLASRKDAVIVPTADSRSARIPESERSEHVLCVIITDGLENASRKHATIDVNDRCIETCLELDIPVPDGEPDCPSDRGNP